MIGEFSSNGSDKSLSVSVLTWAVRRRSEGSDGKHVFHESSGVDKDRVIVVNKVSREDSSVRECFFQVLSQPMHVRMRRNVHVQNLSCGMLNDEEDIERSEVPRRNNKEVHGRSLRGVKVEKVLPVPFGSFRTFRHIFTYGIDMQAIASSL